MDLKKKSHALKTRAAQLGYQLKLTHAQELVAHLEGYRSRHSALLAPPSAATPENSYPNLRINRLCQSCERGPRAFTRLHGNQVWQLCAACVQAPSKFSLAEGASDLTGRHPLNTLYLRDIKFNPRPHETGRPGAFMFRLICSDGTYGDRYLRLPTLGSGYAELSVWNIDKNQTDNGWWDWPIELLPNWPNEK